MARRRKPRQTLMFTDGQELPLFCGVAQRQTLAPYNPQELPVQDTIPGFRWQPTMKEMYDNRAKIIRPQRRRRRR